MPLKFIRRDSCLRAVIVSCAIALCSLSATYSAAAEKRSMCVFDPLGATGPVFSLTKDSKVKALEWGYDIELRAYTDEKIASDDFLAGQCDAVLLTDVRAREFNKFTGTLVALGAIPGYDELSTLLRTLSSPKAAPLMRSENYEIVGIAPAGAVYVFLRDRSIDQVEKIQGKKIATLDYDPAAVVMVRQVGASVVSATTSSFAGKFNNGSVDVAYAPAVAYEPLELYKGVQPDGAILKYDFAQMTFQLVASADKFSELFKQNMREYYQSRFDEFLAIVKKAEADIPESVWLVPSKEQVAGFDNLLREVRITLRDDGVYHPKTLKLMLKVRCQADATKAECIDGRE